MELLTQLLDNVGVLLLIFSRFTGIFVSAPFFSQNNVPTYIKIGFSLICAFIIFPIVEIPIGFTIDSFSNLLFNSFKEFVVGILIGFICYLFFSIVYLAGHLIDMEIGFSIASVINPLDDTEIPLTANLLFIMATLIFLSIDGHHSLIQAAKRSFDLVPIGKLNINIFMIDGFISILSHTFLIGFKMAAPIIVSTFLSNVVLGILARIMPQMNVFAVGMPLKVLLGMLVLVAILPLYVGFFEYIFDDMFSKLIDFLKTISRG